MSILDSVSGIFSGALGVSQSQDVATSPDGFSINNFRAKINQKGVLKSNLFLVNFSMPNCLQSSYGNFNRDLFYYTQAGELPGVTFATADAVRRYGYGPVEKFAFLPVFQDLSLTFIMDGQGENRKFFDNWMAAIGNFYNPNGVTADTNPQNGFQPYELEYKQNYVVDVNITVYNEVADTILIYTLKDAFPVSVSGSSLSWASQNELMSVGVTFTFRDWYSNSLAISDISKSNNIPNLSLFQNVIGTGSLSQTINAFTTPKTIGDIINVVNNGSIIGQVTSAITNLF